MRTELLPISSYSESEPVIPFQTWFSQIVGYGHFIADTSGVRRAWVDGDCSQTSVSDFDELYEQIFDDLDSDAFERDLHKSLPRDPGAQELLATFLQEIRAIDSMRGHDHRLQSATGLLGSAEWSRLVEVARRIVSRFPISEVGGEMELNGG
jgi:hypothetical protein